MNKIKRSRFKVLDDGNPGPEGDAKVDHVGAEMRRARLEKGLTVAFLAETLRIRESYIVAIEEGRYDQMPGPAYALGFIRSYAGYLGLDGREMVQRFKDEVGSQERLARPGRLAFPAPLADGRGSFGALLILAIVLGAVVYAGWYWYSNREQGLGGLDAPVPGRTDAPVRPAALPTAREPATAGAPASTAPSLGASGEMSSQSGLAPSGGETATGGAARVPPGPVSPNPTSTTPATTSPATTGPATTGPAAGSGTADAENGSTGVVILAKRDSWIQVRDEAGSMLTSTVLRAGETYRVPNRPGLMLMTGNAGGIEIVVDGRTLPALGQEGTIRRDVSLDREKLQSALP